MSEGPKKVAPRQGSVGNGNVDALASQALSLVASRSPHHAAQIFNMLVDNLVAAVRSFDTAAQEAALQDLRDRGCTAEEISDIYIPAAARLLGDEWCRDNVSFADVTIGVARLQAMLRDLEAEWSVVRPDHRDQRTVLVIVCQDEYHTLGAMVLAGQLRRLGVSVRLSIGQSDLERLELIKSNDFSMVMISASRTENLVSTRKLVESIRTVSNGDIPIVIGGSVLDNERNVKALTGADHVINDPREALRLCGLKIHHHGAEFSETRG